jgi:hypothetical protein
MKTIGRGLMLAAPMLMKTLTVVGTVAMFLVGGGILAHGMPPVHHGIEQVAELSGVMGSMVSMALNALMGMICGTIALLGMLAFSAIRKMMAGSRHEQSASPVGKMVSLGPVDRCLCVRQLPDRAGRYRSRKSAQG